MAELAAKVVWLDKGEWVIPVKSVQHNHREYVEGCFRCELSRDECDG